MDIYGGHLCNGDRVIIMVITIDEWAHFYAYGCRRPILFSLLIHLFFIFLIKNAMLLCRVLRVDDYELFDRTPKAYASYILNYDSTPRTIDFSTTTRKLIFTCRVRRACSTALTAV